jgi:hypothetical protein
MVKETGRVGSLLDRPTHSSSFSVQASPLQEQVEGYVEGFVRESTGMSTLASLMGGSLLGRLGRLGILSAETFPAWLKVPLSLGVGLGAEATSYELLQRSFLQFSENAYRNPHLFRWEGEGGLGRGIFSSLISFGALKGAGNLAARENIIFQHLVQDSALVAGQQISGAWGFGENPQGSLTEQYLHAEVLNWQLSTSASLLHGLIPEWEGLELALDLDTRSKLQRSPLSKLSLSSLFMPAMAQETKSHELHRDYEASGSVRGEGEKKEVPLIRSLKESLEKGMGIRIQEPSDILKVLQEPIVNRQGPLSPETDVVLQEMRNDFQILSQEGRGASVSEYFLAMKRLLIAAEHRILYAQYGLKGLFDRNVLGQYDRILFNPLTQLDGEYWYPTGAKVGSQAPTPYSPAAEAWWNELMPQLRQARANLSRLNSRDEFLSHRVDENLINQVWFYQLLHFAEELGANVSVRQASRLADSFHPEAPQAESALLTRTLSRLEGEQLDPLSLSVLELEIPYHNVVFGKRNLPEAVLASVPHLISVFQANLGGTIRLKHVNPDGTLVLRIPSPSLLERLLETAHGERAPRFYYLDGEVSRDEMMRARELGVALIGFVRNPRILGDVDAMIPSWAYPFHDIFHAFMVAQYEEPIRRFAAALYRLGTAQPAGFHLIGDPHWNRLVDYDQHPKTYLRYSLKYLLEDAQTPLPQKVDFVRTYLELLKDLSPPDSMQAPYLEQFRGELLRVDAKLGRKRTLSSLLNLLFSKTRR